MQRGPRPKAWWGAALVVLVALAALLTGCAHDVVARFPSSPDEPTGTVELRFTRAASDVTVAVNGVVVVDRAHTRRVVVTGVPTGTTQLAIAAGAGEKQVAVWVGSDNPVQVPVPSVEQSATTGLRGFVLSMMSVVVYALLR